MKLIWLNEFCFVFFSNYFHWAQKCWRFEYTTMRDESVHTARIERKNTLTRRWDSIFASSGEKQREQLRIAFTILPCARHRTNRIESDKLLNGTHCNAMNRMCVVCVVVVVVVVSTLRFAFAICRTWAKTTFRVNFMRLSHHPNKRQHAIRFKHFLNGVICVCGVVAFGCLCFEFCFWAHTICDIVTSPVGHIMTLCERRTYLHKHKSDSHLDFHGEYENDTAALQHQFARLPIWAHS